MRTSRQRGQAMVEFMIITPVMLLLVFGAMQFAFLYHVKTALNYATFQTAREGAVNNAHMAIMEAALARNLAAIYTHDDTIDQVKQARDRIRQEIEDGYVQIRVINPTPEMFDTFGIDPDGDGDREIPSDNLMYRPLTREPISGVTVQDANLLKIRVTYCYPMFVPYVNRVLAIMLTQPPDPDDCPGCSGVFQSTSAFERQCLDAGRFPLNSMAIVRMHSPATESAIAATTAGSASGGTATTLTGFWHLDITRPANP